MREPALPPAGHDMQLGWCAEGLQVPEQSEGSPLCSGLETFYEAVSFPKLNGVNVSSALCKPTRLFFIGTENINAADYMAEASNNVGPIFFH
jgi:hypothetical protein